MPEQRTKKAMRIVKGKAGKAIKCLIKTGIKCRANGRRKMENTFEAIWQLLNPQGEFKRRRGACERLWQGYEAARQERIYSVIKGKLERGEFVNQNPYFAIDDNAQECKPRRETLTFAQYYAKYGTTELRDGWHMENPTGQQVIYVRNG